MFKRAAILIVSCALFGAGCASRPATVPMPTRFDAGACPAATDTLLVLLPGARSPIDEFEREGFVDAVRERGLAVDVVRADAHRGYYDASLAVVQRLREDVIAPAQARGYRSIWIAGISLGGLGGALYAQAHPADVAGLVLIAPYLGERATATDIDNAGGLVNWQAPTGPLQPPQQTAREFRDPALWRWLQTRAAQPQDAGSPPLYLGYGREDRFAFNHRLLGAALPAARVATTAGGHDWPAWRRLWQSLLSTLPLPRCG